MVTAAVRPSGCRRQHCWATSALTYSRPPTPTPFAAGVNTMSWNNLETADPELAAFGAQRFASTGVAYLATVRADGAPRVYPVTPILGDGRLFLFMEPSSPKGHDLQRDGRYAMHCSVENAS